MLAKNCNVAIGMFSHQPELGTHSFGRRQSNLEYLICEFSREQIHVFFHILCIQWWTVELELDTQRGEVRTGVDECTTLRYWLPVFGSGAYCTSPTIQVLQYEHIGNRQ